MASSNSPTSPRREDCHYTLRSDCNGGFCTCNSTPGIQRSALVALQCKNSRSVDQDSSLKSTCGNGFTASANRVSSLKDGSRGSHFKKYRGIHLPENLNCAVKDSNVWSTDNTSQEYYLAKPTLLTNGHATVKNIEMSTTSSTTRISRKIVSQQEFQSGSGDGSFVSLSNSSNRSTNERFAHPGYRTHRTFASETVESGSGKGFVEKRRDLNGSVVVSDDEDDFLHRKPTIKFRHRCTSDGHDIGQYEQNVFNKSLRVVTSCLGSIAWYFYNVVVTIFVYEKWFLKKSNNSTYREDLYYQNKRMGYASNGTNEGVSSKFRHLFFSDKKLTSNHNDSTERRNVMVFSNSNSHDSKSSKTTYNNSQSQDHLSDEEHFTSSWNRSRGLTTGCLKIFAALLLVAVIGCLAYLLWSPISSYASATSEFVGSCLSSIITQTVGVLSYLGSLSLFGFGKTSDSIVIIPSVPVTEESANVQTASSINPIPTPIPPIISKEELDDILSRLQFLEKKIVDHDNTFTLYDTKYNELKVHITQLESAMQEASAKGKTPDQILMEIMNFHLGETSDGKIVTLSNLVTLWNTKTQDESSTLDMKLKALAVEMAANADTSKSDRDQIKVDMNNLKLTQNKAEVEIKSLHKPVEVDMKKLQQSILPVLMSEIGNQVKISCATRDCPEPTPGGGIVGGTQEDMDKLIKMAIAKYDADKTGLPDLALESAGGTILSTRCTKSSKLRNSVVSFFGFKIWSPPNNPRTIIQPGVVPGECWAFEGSVGDIVIQLVAPSIVTGFTVEHISKNVSPYGNIDSAPYKFEVWGLNAENDFDTMWNYGSFSYEDNGETLQHFPVQNANAKAYPIVELKILSNHGNLRHTCLYRFRVHGALDMKVMSVKIEPHTSEV